MVCFVWFVFGFSFFLQGKASQSFSREKEMVGREQQEPGSSLGARAPGAVGVPHGSIMAGPGSQGLSHHPRQEQADVGHQGQPQPWASGIPLGTGISQGQAGIWAHGWTHGWAEQGHGELKTGPTGMSLGQELTTQGG